jgi:hypothetical protein
VALINPLQFRLSNREKQKMNFDDLDAQLAALQAELKSDIKKSQETSSDFSWPKPPDFDFSPQIEPQTDQEDFPPPPIELQSPPTIQTAPPIKSGNNNSKAEAEVDNLTSKLMTDLENGTAAQPNTNANAGPESIGDCHKCHLPILGHDEACSAMGYNFHIKCLCCLKCGKNLHGQEFIVMGTDDPYCQPCYEKSLECCCVCGETIKTRILRAANKVYHPECFKCTNCKCVLDGIPFTQDSEKRPYCITCYQELHSPKCFKCTKAIAPEPGEKEAMRIIAMEKSFHKGCFTCKVNT